MAGILDSKTRVLDTVVTQIGRRQIASGRLRPEFISFTDAAAYYEADAVSGSSDATGRIYFESRGKRRQDFITFETDDSGNLLGYPTDPNLSIMGEELFKTANSASVDDINNFVFVSGSGDFASLTRGIVTSSIDHFKQLYMLGSSIVAEGTEGFSQDFKVDKEDISFSVINTFPWPDGPKENTSNIDAIEPLFIDKRLSHLPNFKFLPPMVREPKTYPFNKKEERKINRKSGKRRKLFLGKYKSFSEFPEEMTYEDLMTEMNGPGTNGIDPDALRDYESVETISAWSQVELDGSQSGVPMGTVFGGQQVGVINLSPIEVARERYSINFTDTSNENNIVMQMFETNSKKKRFKKLDVIDYGVIIDELDVERPSRRIFFVGKIFLNSVNIPVFVNLFTLILD